jgi:hypothetical protein
MSILILLLVFCIALQFCVIIALVYFWFKVREISKQIDSIFDMCANIEGWTEPDEINLN